MKRISSVYFFPFLNTYKFQGTCYLLSKDSFRSFPEFRRQFQHVSSHRLLSKNWETLSLFPLIKRVLLPALRLQPIIWLLPPPSPQPVVLLNDLHSLLRPTKWGLWSTDSLTYILTWIRYFVQLTGRKELTFIHIPL